MMEAFQVRLVHRGEKVPLKFSMMAKDEGHVRAKLGVWYKMGYEVETDGIQKEGAR